MRGLARVILLLAVFAAGNLAAQTDALIAKADALSARDENKAALAILVEADKQKPSDAEILRRIADQNISLFLATKSETEKKQFGQQAMDAAQRVVKITPDSSSAHLSLAVIYGRIAFLEPARRKIELSRLIESEAAAAVLLNPREEYAWHVLGCWNYELSDFNPVLKSLAEVIYGKFPDCSYEKAAEDFRKAIAINPHAVIHHIELGRTYLAMGKKAEAKAELEKGLALPSTGKDDEETKERGRLALKGL